MSTKRIKDHSRLLEDDNNCVLRLVREWKPLPQSGDNTKKEKAYERELHAWLQSKLPDVPIVAQYGIAKGRADLVIEDKHVIELKLGFTAESVNEFDRCIGQLERYKQKWVKKERGPVYLVVVGESDAEFRDLLHTWFKEANGAFLTMSPFHLIEKLPERMKKC